MIQISPEAAAKIGALKKEDGKDDSAFLRVEVKKGGCSGLSYKMNFESVPRDGDKYFESHGQKIAVAPNSMMYLLGMTLEYSGGLNGKGFVFNNPNAAKQCGCGSSFNV
ncbi:heme biosynthesis protein HemY [Bdellovibrio bacteriovorus]|uniref:Heme biosynthesis protein HemY n=1 Tax=Bdellovibrio bacteriovorus TaxID=959 RepID=A0A150WFI9_BDEBC|nr:iron-sulfur cluster assembly accessory protein [Bdellovibrio bacteriovorus]KYG61635.1 heme biosynthesis protein HemY [Bdellovibrio bacteriovorus]